MSEVVPSTGKTAVAHWRATAQAHPDDLAVVCPDGKITYGQAMAFADRRCAAVTAAAGELSRPIAIDIESDIESVLAVLTVLCSGHPVILLDPLLPEDRRDHILDLSGAKRVGPAEIAALPTSDNAAPDPAPGDGAVMIFTSGSTGMPKGLVHSQRGWVNQAADGKTFMGLGRGDRMAVLLPLSFGAGFDCLMMGLLNGATLMLWDVRRRTTAGLRDWLATGGASTIHCTPSLLRSWLPDLAAAQALDGVRLLSTCGEPIHRSDVEHLRRTLLPGGTYCSWSGSSEIGNLAFNLFPPQRELPDGVIPVGTPATDKDIRIVDEAGVDVPTGQTGELYVESGHMALRYHGDPEMTAARFQAIADGRFRLRTGDLARLDESGQLHLMGRRDDAVKIRGYLVEPAEVEAALRALSWTTEAVVTADKDAGILIAYVAVKAGGWAPSPGEVRTALAQRLPPWMIPRDVVIMTALPRNERGKVDRTALPSAPERAPEPLRGPTEAALGHVWCEVLGLESVGRNEDFISLGGDSMAAATMLTELRERWLVDISSAEFIEHPTIAALGAALDAAHRERSNSQASGSISTLREGDGLPLFLAAGAGSPAAGLLPLVRRLPGDGPVYGVQAHGLERRGRADRSIRAAARRAVRDIRATTPQGPYRLGGYSMGAFVMLEAAAILHADGQDCERVILIDPVLEPELLARITGGDSRASWLQRSRRGASALPDRGEGFEATSDGVPGSRKADLAQRLTVWWNAVAMRALVGTAGLVNLPTTLRWTVFWDLGRQMIAKHRPTTYSGPVTLIRSSANTDEVSVWKLLADGELVISEVEGDHHSMMREPAVAATAACVFAALSGPDTETEGHDQ